MNYKKLLSISFLGLLITNPSSFAGVSVPSVANLNILSQIASATSFTSNNNNNIDIKNVNQSTSSFVSLEELKENVAIDAAALGLAVDEKALTALTSGGNFSTAGIDNLGDAVEGLGLLETPDATPDTYVYDTGLMTLTRDTDYANKNIFSTADGAQQGRIQVFIDFEKKLFWGDVIAYPTVNSNALQNGDKDYANPSLGTSSITSLPVTANTNYTIRYDIDGMTGSVTDLSSCGESSCRTNATTLNMDDDGLPNTGDNSNMKKYMNHNGTVSNSGDSFGGIVVHGEFATATVSSDGTATIAFEAADCNGCNDSDFAGSIERWSATGSTAAKKGEGVDLARTQLSTAFQSEE